jgi:nucleotide-binding universal stress UspA family protein
MEGVMLNTILVPLDGSELAERALAPALGLVKHGGGKLILVRAATTHGIPGPDQADEQVRVITEAEEYLKTMALELKGRGVTAETGVPYGPAAEGILDEIRLRRPDLVVMATHGRSGLGRWLYGSVAEAVLGRSTTPILLTRAWHAEQPARSAAEYERLIVPLDGSTFAEAALPLATELAATIGAELVLLRVIFPPQEARYGENGRVLSYIDQELESLQTDANRYLAQIERRIREQYPTVRTMIDVRLGLPVDGIVSASERAGATMVVMATHGRTGLSRLFLGSVAGAVLRTGEVPLLLIRPRQLPPASGLLTPPADETTAETGQTVELALSTAEIDLIRYALGSLNQSVTRHEHLHQRIHNLLARLPETASKEAPPAR